MPAGNTSSGHTANSVNSTLLALANTLGAIGSSLRELASSAVTDAAQWIAQNKSPLGRRLHCAEVRRLVAAGDHRAAIVGRRFLLTQAAVDAALRDHSIRRFKTNMPSVTEQLSSALQAQKGEVHNA